MIKAKSPRLGNRDLQVISWIFKQYKKTYMIPMKNEIAKHFGFSRQGASYYLNRLQHFGVLKYNDHFNIYEVNKNDFKKLEDYMSDILSDNESIYFHKIKQSPDREVIKNDK